MSTPWIDPLLVLLATVGVGGFAFGSLRACSAKNRLARASAGALGVCFAGFAALAAGFGQPLAVWLPPAAMVALWLTLCFLRTGVAHRLGVCVGSTRCQSALLLGCGVLAVVWTVRATEVEPLTTFNPPSNTGGAGERVLEDISPSPARTDHNQPVKIRSRVLKARFTPEFLARQSALLDRLGLRERVITLPDADQDCNCHGWVFTGGQYWVASEEVQTILDDNGYQAVTEPHPGDLVIYRDESGAISHTGLLRTAGGDCPLLVESKWGGIGRFIHQAADHAYGDMTWTFYRSARNGHILRGLSASPDLSDNHAE